MRDAIAAGEVDPTPFDTIPRSELAEPDLARRYHEARIAWLVLNPDATPIEIDIGIPSIGYEPRHHPFDFIDGNHRLCAAAVRNDTHIAVTFGGECEHFPAVFPAAHRIRDHHQRGESMTDEDIKAGDVIRAKGIDWDDDGDAPELPSEVELTIPDEWSQGDIVADLLSDKYGFCINGIGTLERV